MTITAEILQIERLMQDILDTHLDDHARILTQAWATAWEDVKTELEAAILGQVAKGNVDKAIPIDPARLERALAGLAQSLDDLVDTSDALIRSSVDAIVRLGVDGEHRMMLQQLPEGKIPLLASPEEITVMIRRSAEQITAAHWPISRDADAAIRRRLVRGVTVGDNPRLVADQIVNDVGGDFNGGLARALNISRTEMLDAMRAGQHATDQANTDVLIGWRWIAHLDPRTCRSCIAKHGGIHPIEEPGPFDHHSGRCARVPATRTWAELGFHGIEEPPDLIPDALAWLREQPEDVQAQILTRRGLEQWRAGNYPPEAWTQKRTNDQWRDSWAPTTPPGRTR